MDISWIIVIILCIIILCLVLYGIFNEKAFEDALEDGEREYDILSMKYEELTNNYKELLDTYSQSVDKHDKAYDDIYNKCKMLEFENEKLNAILNYAKNDVVATEESLNEKEENKKED